LQLYASGGLERRDSAIRFLEGLQKLSMTTIWREAEAMEKWGREELAEWLLYLNMSLRDMLVLYEDGSSPLIYQEDCRERLAALLPSFPERKVFALLGCVREMQKRLGANVNLRLQLEGFFIRLRDVMQM
jgi:DNA polymerase-3 subunit delta'